jgi:hypothetical protein
MTDAERRQLLGYLDRAAHELIAAEGPATAAADDLPVRMLWEIQDDLRNLIRMLERANNTETKVGDQ